MIYKSAIKIGSNEYHLNIVDNMLTKNKATIINKLSFSILNSKIFVKKKTISNLQ